MAAARNILFIMFDQLRFDYLSCAGHKTLSTPNIDRLAAKGVRFDRTYVQSPVCGASRMSFYTGRYCHSHGATWNGVPLKVGEQTLGDHLRKSGMDCWLVGKTHMRADTEGMTRLGLRPDSIIGARVAECGFDVWERDDGMRPEGPDGLYDEDGASTYNEYLRANGYEAENPWHDFANSGRDDDGRIASGWFLKNASRAAAIPNEHSETPYLTTRAMEFIESRDDTPWCLHLSYIKPHWPYIVPEPYFSMFSPQDVPPPNRGEDELIDAHPVFSAFAEGRIGKAFSRDEVRRSVIPAYMGLIKQADDQMGRLFDWLEETGRMDDTMIVLTSDHGDYLGDHWMGEKDLFHDPSVRVPLIVYDPSEKADATRGTVSEELIETIDLAPTFIEIAGGEVPDYILEGRSLLPILHGEAPAWRDYAISEYDYSITPAAVALGTSVRESHLVMVCDKDWKFMHADGFRPMLFDLKNDPNELNDLGADPAYDAIIDKMYDRLLAWALRPSQRTTRSEAQLIAMRGGSRRKGIVLGIYDETEVDEELIAKYLP
ncbi:alkaline phosphatase family protein [Litoreibacter albidus]|uniref:alkaline phosphatase family protein n=1 Tax=Litoreibacter albidus TaxID=670155 RepID=UPI003735F8FA